MALSYITCSFISAVEHLEKKKIKVGNSRRSLCANKSSMKFSRRYIRDEYILAYIIEGDERISLAFLGVHYILGVYLIKLMEIGFREDRSDILIPSNVIRFQNANNYTYEIGRNYNGFQFTSAPNSLTRRVYYIIL